MRDWYFKRELFIDYITAVIVSLICYLLFKQYKFSLPTDDVLLSVTGDLSTISLTFAGFILTLLTILITSKSTAEVPTDETQHSVPLFDIFFSTPLYFKTVVLLKNAIKSLIVVAMTGYLLKLFLRGGVINYLFFFDIISVWVITLTLWRNLTILSLILDLQRNRRTQ